MRNNARHLLTVLITSFVTSHAHTAQAQTVTDSSLRWLVFSVNSLGELDEAPYEILDPSASPVTLDLLSEVEEPTNLVDPPAFFRSGVVADIDSTGTQWSSSGRATAQYAENLDLSVDYGGSVIPAATALVFYTVEFTLQAPTTVHLEADFLSEFTDPFNPSTIANDFIVELSQNGTEITESAFDFFQPGVLQQYSDSVVLEAGDYTFRSSLLLNTQEMIGFRDGSIEFGYNITFIPAPSSFVLIAGVGLLTRRRTSDRI